MYIMNRNLFFLWLIIGMIIPQLHYAQTYTIPYGMGIDTLYVQAGDEIIKPIVFYQTGDDFAREASVQNIIPMSSHGFTFFIDHPQFIEDTLQNTITIISGTFVNDPRILAIRDDRTGGDMREPPKEKKSDTTYPFWPAPLTAGIVILLFLGIAKWRKWL